MKRPVVAAAEGDGEKQSTRLIRIGEGAGLFSSSDSDPYASIAVAGHREVWMVMGKRFRLWLLERYYDEYGSAPGGGATKEALEQLAAKAMFGAPRYPVGTRLAKYEGAIYLDLADNDWSVIEITKGGWRPCASSPVRFRRPPGMLQLPAPSRGGSIDELRGFLNVSDQDFVLVCAWLIAALWPSGPYPILVVVGEPGSAKSTICRALRGLIDPYLALVRSLPHNERDLLIAAKNNRILAYDNLSYLPSETADAFCRLATGGGLSTRTLFSDEGEKIFDAQRPLLLNGIEELTTRGDLADRAIVLTLPRIPDSKRRPEEHYWADFEAAKPRILGALLDAAATALRRIETLQLEQHPRMADFARLAVAAEQSFGFAPGSFLQAYEQNRSHGHEVVLHSSPLAAAITALVTRAAFFGSATDLLQALRAQAEGTAALRQLPTDAPRLSAALRRMAPALRATGIEIEVDQPLPGLKSRRGIRLTATVNVSTVSTVTTLPHTQASKDRRPGKTDAGDGNDARKPNRSKPPDSDRPELRPDDQDERSDEQLRAW